MEKDFDTWNEYKKSIEKIDKRFFFKEGEIWWCSIGINVGNESCGKGKSFRRPMLVIKKLSASNFIGVPLSTKIKKGSWFVDILVEDKVVSAMIYQVRLISVKRFQRRLTTLDAADFSRVKRKLELLLELSSLSPKC